MRARLVSISGLVILGVSGLLIVLRHNSPISFARVANPLPIVVGGDFKHDLSAPLSTLSADSRSSARLTPESPQAIEAINKRLPNRRLDPKLIQQLKSRGVDVNEYIQSLASIDPVVQTKIGLPYAPNAVPPVLFNFEGVNNVNGVLPPDTNGDIGYDPATGKKYYMQWVNLSFAVWEVTLTPTLIVSPTTGNALWAGFGGACETTNDGDPIVLFDHLAQRWLVSQFALPNYPAGPFYQCIAVSQTGNPAGAWYRYGFLAHQTKMNDYPHFGVWPDGYYMTVNQFSNNATAWGGAGVFVFERSKMLLGQAAAFQYVDLFSVNQDFGGMLPADWDGATPPPANSPGYFFEVDDDVVSPALGPDAMRIWKFHVDWTTPANSTFGLNGQPNITLTVAPYNLLPCTLIDTAACIPQPGTSQKIDALGGRLMHRVAYRVLNGSEVAVLNHTVDAGGGRAGVRWYEVRGLGTTPQIVQQSTYAPDDGVSRFMGSAALDRLGNLAIGFSAASSSLFPSIRYAGRLASDPPGTLAQGEATLYAGSGSQTHPAGRWGDYSMLSVDPLDDCTFYYTNEYLATTSSSAWRTRIGSFRFPNCTPGDLSAVIGRVTDSGSGLPVVGAQVAATAVPSGTFATYADFSGGYTLTLPGGVYSLTAATYGYLPSPALNLDATPGTTTTRHFTLTLAPTHVISGYVRDTVTRAPLLATINLAGTPFNPPIGSVNTNVATGFYSVTLAGAQTYTLTASALFHTSQSRGVAPQADRTENFDLVATTTDGGLIGTVRRAIDLQPIAQATVSIADLGRTATTDVNGNFQILNIAPGAYTATASAPLYGSVTLADVQVLTSNVAIREILLPSSRLTFSPVQLQRTLAFGTVVTDNAGLMITNTGALTLIFDLLEMPGGFRPLQPGNAADVLVVNRFSDLPTRAITGALQTLGYTCDVTAALQFEAYTLTQLQAYRAVIYVGNTGASGDNANERQLMAYLDAGGRLLIADNDLGYFTHGSLFFDTYLQANYVADDPGPDQALSGEDLLAGLTTSVADDPYPDAFLPRSTAGVRLFAYTAVGSAASLRVERGGYRAIYFAFDFQYLGTAALGESIETEVLRRSLDWLIDPNGAALPWLIESPISGTLTTSGTQALQLSWDANNAAVDQPGTYFGSLRLRSNDPIAPSSVVPVSMTVLPASTQGLITGTVRSTGVCDSNEWPLSGASVFVQGADGFTRTLVTNGAGAFSYYVDASHSPLTITVSANDHPLTTITTTLAGGDVISREFVLRLQRPCIHAQPDRLEATLNLGEAVTQELVITNTGATPLSFVIDEVPDALAAQGGPDAFGYTWRAAHFNWVDATNGTPLDLPDDGAVGVTLPFAVSLYDRTSAQVCISNNGALQVGALTCYLNPANDQLALALPYLIAPFWDDLDARNGNVYWKVIGAAPDRKLVVEWFNRPHYSNLGGVTFEVVLFENGNALFQYHDVDFGSASLDNGASATIGLFGSGTADRLLYSYQSASLQTGSAICFVRSGNPPCDRVDVPWLSASITTTTGLIGTPPHAQSISVTLNAGAVSQAGVYRADLLIAHDAPRPYVRVPVTLTVLSRRHDIYLPVIAQRYPPAPNLRPIKFEVSPPSPALNQAVQVQLVVQNVGTRSTDFGFWIDLYLDPVTPPAQTNQPWTTLCAAPLPNCFGGAWYVGTALAPGQSITLTANDLQGDYSYWPGRFTTSGPHMLYVYVDSWNPPLSYGAVQESDEADNRASLSVNVTGGNLPVPAWPTKNEIPDRPLKP